MSKYQIVLHGSAVFNSSVSGTPRLGCFEQIAGRAASLLDAIHRAEVLANNASLLVRGTHVELVYVVIVSEGQSIAIASFDGFKLRWLKSCKWSQKRLEMKIQSLNDAYLNALIGYEQIGLHLQLKMFKTVLSLRSSSVNLLALHG